MLGAGWRDMCAGSRRGGSGERAADGGDEASAVGVVLDEVGAVLDVDALEVGAGQPADQAGALEEFLAVVGEGHVGLADLGEYAGRAVARCRVHIVAVPVAADG